MDNVISSVPPFLHSSIRWDPRATLPHCPVVGESIGILDVRCKLKLKRLRLRLRACRCLSSPTLKSSGPRKGWTLRGARLM